MMTANELTEEIIPRYEFRAFAQSFGKIVDEIRKRAKTELIRESTDIYVVSKGNDANNIKLRADQIDMKQLIGVKDGLEQWFPALKESFPVESAVIHDKIFPALQVKSPALERDVYEAETFLNELIWPHPEVQQAEVFKQRFHFMIEGCMVELNELLINRAAIKSVAIEAADPEAVLRVRDAVGLGAYENVNYLKAIKRILGLAPLPSL